MPSSKPSAWLVLSVNTYKSLMAHCGVLQSVSLIRSSGPDTGHLSQMLAACSGFRGSRLIQTHLFSGRTNSMKEWNVWLMCNVSKCRLQTDWHWVFCPGRFWSPSAWLSRGHISCHTSAQSSSSSGWKCTHSSPPRFRPSLSKHHFSQKLFSFILGIVQVQRCWPSCHIGRCTCKCMRLLCSCRPCWCRSGSRPSHTRQCPHNLLSRSLKHSIYVNYKTFSKQTLGTLSTKTLTGTKMKLKNSSEPYNPWNLFTLLTSQFQNLCLKKQHQVETAQ